MKKLFIFLLTICAIQYATAQSCADGSYEFADMVAIFNANGCLGCHGAQGGLDLDVYANVIAGGNTGTCPPNYNTVIDFIIGKADGTLTAGDGCGSAMPNGAAFGTVTFSAADVAALQAWQASGAPEFCPAPPANDLCADATVLACGAALVGEDSSTSTDQSGDVGCGMGAGIWYTITGTGDNVTIDITNDAFDVEVAVASGACGGLTNISCTDGGITSESTTFPTVAGTTYYIYVGDFATGGTDAGTFDLAVTCVPPPMPAANDMCADAVAVPVNADLACGMVLNATILGATDSGLDVPPEDNTICGGTEDDDVWFTFVATNDIHQIDLTNITGSTTDLYHSVWEGSCGMLTNIICSDPNTSTLTGLTPGTTYYVRVYSWTATTGQDSVFDVCVGTPPPPPPGDECTDPIPYPGDVVAGTCVTGFDFTIFTDNGNPSPTCDFGGDAVAWFSWTAPIVTAAGDPLDVTFDDGDGQAMDCDIGIEVYDIDCTTPVSNCLGNISGTLTGLTQGTDYVLLIYDDSAPEASCDFCLSVACSAPEIIAFTRCQTGTEDSFLVTINVLNMGVGNSAYTVDVGGMPQGNITGGGSATYGPFPAGTPVDVVITGVDDPSCGFTATGLIKDCTCPADLALTGLAGPYCTTDAAVPLTYTPAGPFESSVSIEFLTAGTFDTEISLGLYPGTFDDGSVIGLPPAGTGLLGTGDETDIENSAPGANDLNAVEVYSPAPVGAPIVISNLAAGDYTIYLGDDFGDGWNGATLLVTDECGNVLATEAPIQAISGDVQDELAWVNFTLPIAAPFVQVSGNGVVQTSDPDGVPNNGDETYEFDPSQVVVTGCDPITEPIILTTLICDVICDFVVDVDVFPPAQAPTITRDDDVCNYTITEACTGDILDVTSTTAAPDSDPAPIDVIVTTANGCTATFPVDPSACPPIAATCQGIDLAAGLPVIPTTVCSGATADICLTLLDAAEGLVVTGTVDGAPVMLTGVAGAGANELCVTIDAPTNETCAPVDVVISITTIQCTDGTDYPGILGGATLVDDLTTAGLNPLNVPVYPTLEVTTSGDGMCGSLMAELTAADGTPCATAAGSPFTCTADGETLDYDFTADVAAFTDVPADCPLPTLTGSLACTGCTVLGCTDPCAPNYDPAAGQDDGTCEDYDDTCNADCTAGPFGGTWDPDTCACINETAPILGCTDATACNFDPAANCDDGNCLPAPVCNTDPCVGDIEIVDPNDACACIVDQPQVLGCTDATADNYDPAANCDDGSCVTTTLFTFSISDPCNCTDGIDEDMDGINDLALETITFNPGSAPYDVTGLTGSLVDATGTALSDTDIEALIVAADPGDGTSFDIEVYLPADGSSVYSIEVTDGSGTVVELIKPSGCPVCPNVANIPTVGEWGLIILGLLMSITAVVGIRQRREEEVYG